MPAFFAYRTIVEADAQVAMPVGGTLSKLNVLINNTPAGGDSWTFTVHIDGAPGATPVDCSIATGVFSCSDNTDSVTFTAGQTLSIKATGSGDPADAEARWTAVVISS
ncbi:MAG: hypothetical protein ACRDJI_02725 [Actinomycetota bacterium]